MTTATATPLHPDPNGLEPRFAAVYAEHVDYVWTNLRRLGVPTADLDDATQEAFLVAFRRWDDFRGGASWRAWLFGITRRVASHYRRGSSRRLRLLRRAEQSPSPPYDPRDELDRRQATALVQRFLHDLPPRKREVFILAEIEGFTGAEIAHALAIKPNTVWSRLRGAREAFDRYLGTLRAREDGAAARLDRVALMQRCRKEHAPPESKQRVLGALGLHLAGPTGPAWWIALKPVAVSVGLGLGGLLGVAGIARVTAPPETVAPSSVARVDPPGSAAAGVTRSKAAPSTEHAPSTDPNATLADVAPESGSRSVLAHGPATDRSVADARVTAPASSSSPLSSSPSPSPSSSSSSSPSPSSSSSSSSSSSPSSAPSSGASSGPTARALDLGRFAEETALLQRIRAASRDADYPRALGLAEDHARRFPGGALGPERQALRIAALCHLGRHAEARAQATAWTRSHPHDALAPEIRHGCAPDDPQQK